MPCSFPNQGLLTVLPSGVRNVKIVPAWKALFRKGVDLVSLAASFGGEHVSLPCGNCMPCRLERSRQWALRCVHESKMFEFNCFITLTYDPAFLPEGGTLVRKHPQDFLKRLRERFDGIDAVMIDGELRKPIRYYGCGEYGEEGDRPHYHLCLFNFDFSDRKFFSRRDGFNYYTSEVLREIWGFGNVTVCDFSFETAAYVARYCTKKINGSLAESHYAGRLPEFPMMSNRPGIGRLWLDKFGDSDVFPHDECIARGHPCKPPRYYDKIREKRDPVGFALVKEERKRVGLERAADNTYDRLATKLKCMRARFSKLIRRFDGA